ncbi:polysaccharide deacetylase family protein [Candidatus Woesearchaeota archaeon]|nr:polysaccharide deacetylase family protein [Candidatus Woesearchaeota archaeon]
MTNICFYFQVHQPYRLKKYSLFDIGQNMNYFDDNKNKEIMEKVAKKCYLPANKILLELMHKYNGRFKIAFSITGTAIEQFEQYAPKVLDSFKSMADTGCVEFLSETYYHSLATLFDKKEFVQQIEQHQTAIKKLFGQKPTVFRNTELVYNNEIASTVETLGYKAILAEGADHILGWRSPNFVYKPRHSKRMKLLLKNYRLSDDIAFRFGNKQWEQYPVTARKYADWISSIMGDTINLFMDYETFGEHQWEDTGIFKFLRELPYEIFKRKLGFQTPTELIDIEAKDELDIHNPLSWADIERDVSAWLGNSMQNSAMHRLYAMKQAVYASRDEQLINAWKKLTTSDHFYYMCTKWFNDGDVHKYFNPYDTPYDSFITFMNVLNDIAFRLKIEAKQETIPLPRQWIKA